MQGFIFFIKSSYYRQRSRSGEEYTCTDSYWQESATKNTGYYAEGMNGDVLVLYYHPGSNYPNFSEDQCASGFYPVSSYTPTNFPTGGAIYYLENSSTWIRYNHTDEIKEWIDLCGEDDIISFDKDGYAGGATSFCIDGTPYHEGVGCENNVCKRHTRSLPALHEFCRNLASYKERGVYGLQYKKLYIPNGCTERSHGRLYMAAIGYCIIEPAPEYYTGTVNCCAD